MQNRESLIVNDDLDRLDGIWHVPARRKKRLTDGHRKKNAREKELGSLSHIKVEECKVHGLAEINWRNLRGNKIVIPMSNEYSYLVLPAI